MPPPGLFTLWQEMETLDSAGTAVRPLVQNSIAPSVCSLTVRGTSSLRIRAMSAFGKWSPPRGIFRLWRGMELQDSAGTAARPPALHSLAPRQYSSTVPETYTVQTLFRTPSA